MYSATTRYQYRSLAIKRGKRLALFSRLTSQLTLFYEFLTGATIIAFGILYFFS